ncbi:MAG: hypothetical protein M1121_05405 [Actinobacteria bacterium]|nr:hypothetical protein [Actinomycetota bacterium]
MIEELAARDASLAALKEENDALRAKVAALAEIAFGGSERRGGTGREGDRDLEDLDDEYSAGEGDARDTKPPDGSDGEAGDTPRRGQRRGAPGHGRGSYDHLEVRVVIHDLDEDQRCCLSCGSLYEQIASDEVSSEISWRVVVYRIEHRRRRYRRSCGCESSPALVVAPVPAKVIPKGLFTALAIASVLVDKFALARPVNKIIASLSMQGLDVSPGSLTGVLKRVGVLLGGWCESRVT